VQISGPEPTLSSRAKAASNAEAGWLDSWHVSPSLNKDFDAIDGLRGVAILMVLACHFLYFNPASGGAVRFVAGLFSTGWHGVTIFFALSGFLISHPFWKRKIRGAESVVPKGYGWRRFWKIYPPLALSVILYAPIYFARTGDSSYFATAAKWLVGLPIFLPPRGNFNPVMWSLIIESHFYIVLPLVFLAVRRMSARPSLWIVFLGFLLVPTIYRWADLPRRFVPEFQPFIDVHFPAALDAFAFGILLAGLENMQILKKSWARLGDVGAGLLVATLLAVSWFELHPFASKPLQIELFSWLVKISAGLLLCYIANPVSPRAQLLSAPWLRWCGIISYEWYLVHQPLALWTREYFGGAGGSIFKYASVIAIPFVLSLITAAGVYRFFSLPILKFGRGRNAHA
jgi:peptidoglycan/LPS O-acetylase OafA/YrhL